jgi:hypothetical protein
MNVPMIRYTYLPTLARSPWPELTMVWLSAVRSCSVRYEVLTG